MKPLIKESSEGDQQMLMYCLGCQKNFWSDPNEPLKNVVCEHCGSHNHKPKENKNEVSAKTFNLVNDELLNTQRTLKNKLDRTPKDFEKYNTLLDRWGKHKPKKK